MGSDVQPLQGRGLWAVAARPVRVLKAGRL